VVACSLETPDALWLTDVLEIIEADVLPSLCGLRLGIKIGTEKGCCRSNRPIEESRVVLLPSCGSWVSMLGQQRPQSGE
jgi:hypothetical protein